MYIGKKSEQIFISIVICTYNSKKYIEENLEILSQQTNHNFEVIFVDAFSDDGTLDLIKKFQDGNYVPTKLIQLNPGGVSSAMNAGTQVAEGQYILFSHSDDRLHSTNTLAEIYSELRKNESDWIVGNCDYIDEYSKLIEKKLTSQFEISALYKFCFIPHPAVIIRTHLLRMIGGFNQELKYAMDYDLWFRLAKITSPTYIETTVACFRIHELGLSTKNIFETAIEAHKLKMLYSPSLKFKILEVFSHIHNVSILFAIRAKRLCMSIVS